MRIEARMFLLVAGYFFVVSVVYGWLTWALGNNGIEWAGFLALALSGGLLVLTGGFFWFVSRRIEPRPEDRADAEVAEGAGELGFFSPGSYWPFGLAGAITVTGFGLAFFQVWLIAFGVALVLLAVAGMLFEYYVGGRRFIR